MTVGRQTTGPAAIYLQFDPLNGTPQAFSFLGYTEDGVGVDFRAYQSEVHSDRFGGLQGPPVDVQHFGQTAEIQAKLIDFDMVVFKRLQQRVTKSDLSPNPGAQPIPGCLIASDSQITRVLIVGQKDTAAAAAGAAQATLMTPLNFPQCIPRDVISMEIGSKVMTATVSFTAYPGYNSSISAYELWNYNDVA